MGVLTNCTMNNVTITVPGGEALTDTVAATQVLHISPDEGYTISADGVDTGSVPTGVTSINKANTTSAGAADNKVSITVDIDNTHTVSGNSTITLDITATATEITNYGLVRPAIIENAEHALIDTEVTMAGNSGVSVLTEKSDVNNVDTHYFNSEVPFNTWTKIGTVTVDADNDYTIVYPPYLISNGSEVGLSKFDLIQTSVTEDAVTGIISNYVFDLMFKDTGATGFIWPLGWAASAITDPEMSAVLSVKTILVDVPEYDHVIDGVDLGGGTEDVTSGSDIIPSGGTPPDEPMDTWYAGDAGSTFGISVTEVDGSVVTTEVVGTTTTFTMDASGLQNVPLTFSANQSGNTKEYDVTISGTGTTAILSQVKKTNGGNAHVPYSGINTSSVVNRYKQLSNTNVSIITQGGGNNWSRNGGDPDKTKTDSPLSTISGKDTFTFTRNCTGNIQKKPGAPTTFDAVNDEGVIITVKNLALTTSTVTGTITGDIFYERMGYETKTFTLDFNDWFELVTQP